MFNYLTEFFGRKISSKKQKSADSQVTQPIYYMPLTQLARMKPLDITSYLTGKQDCRLKSNYNINQQEFNFESRQQWHSDYRFYGSIKELIYFERSFIGNPHPQGNYILRLGFDQTTILSLIESERFHLAIIDAFNLADLLRVYGIDRIYGNFTSTSLPVPPESVEIIENPDFSPTLPQDISEKTSSLTTFKH